MITEIECTYTAHFSFKTENLEVDWSRVVDWHIKYGNLCYTLDDGTTGEEYLAEAASTLDNLDFKWPEKIMVCIDGRWVEQGEEEE